MDGAQMIPLMNAYQSIIRGDNNWLLLCYTNGMNLQHIALLSQGANGLEGLKSSFRMQEVQHAVYREEIISDSEIMMITYTPDFISYAQRGRALSNAQRIAMLLKGCQVLMTSINPRDISYEFLARAFLSQRYYATVIHRSTFEPTEAVPVDISVDVMRRTSSGAYDPTNVEQEPRISLPRLNKFLSNILRRSSKSSFTDKMDTPPAIPPKDTPQIIRQGTSSQGHIDPTRGSQESGENDSSIAVISHSQVSDKFQNTQVSHAGPKSRSSYVPLRGKWAVTTISNPVERARFRLQAQLDRQQEEQEAIEEERARQVSIQRRKEELLQKESDDEARRKAIIAEDLKRAAAEQQRREYIQRAEEERIQRLLELRKRVEKEKRREMYQMMEQWRREQLWLQEKTRRELEETKRRRSQMRLQRISHAQALHQENASKNDGWVTIQTNESLVWKRCFFRLGDGMFYLYREAKYLSRPAEVDIRKQVRCVKEWEEGYEELKAIPNSFVLEFVQQGKAWMMYADNEEEKYVILGYVYHLAGW